MYVKVRVTPGAKKEKVEKKGDRWDMWVCQKAERNQANARIKEILSQLYKTSLNKVRIISGHRSPSKIFSIDKTDP